MQRLSKAMSRIFIGQGMGKRSTTVGMTQKEQARVLGDFEAGRCNTLIATCIGEEGLDIPQVDLIVCYDASSSPTRNIQRIGRTGRQREGRVVYLLTSGREMDSYKKTQDSAERLLRLLRDAQSQFDLYRNNPRMVPPFVNPRPVLLNFSKITCKSDTHGEENERLAARGKRKKAARCHSETQVTAAKNSAADSISTWKSGTVKLQTIKTGGQLVVRGGCAPGNAGPSSMGPGHHQDCAPVVDSKAVNTQHSRDNEQSAGCKDKSQLRPAAAAAPLAPGQPLQGADGEKTWSASTPAKGGCQAARYDPEIRNTRYDACQLDDNPRVINEKTMLNGLGCLDALQCAPLLKATSEALRMDRDKYSKLEKSLTPPPLGVLVDRISGTDHPLAFLAIAHRIDDLGVYAQQHPFSKDFKDIVSIEELPLRDRIRMKAKGPGRCWVPPVLGQQGHDQQRPQQHSSTVAVAASELRNCLVPCNTHATKISLKDAPVVPGKQPPASHPVDKELLSLDQRLHAQKRSRLSAAGKVKGERSDLQADVPLRKRRKGVKIRKWMSDIAETADKVEPMRGHVAKHVKKPCMHDDESECQPFKSNFKNSSTTCRQLDNASSLEGDADHKGQLAMKIDMGALPSWTHTEKQVQECVPETPFRTPKRKFIVQAPHGSEIACWSDKKAFSSPPEMPSLDVDCPGTSSSEQRRDSALDHFNGTISGSTPVGLARIEKEHIQVAKTALMITPPPQATRSIQVASMLRPTNRHNCERISQSPTSCPKACASGISPINSMPPKGAPRGAGEETSPVPPWDNGARTPSSHRRLARLSKLRRLKKNICGAQNQRCVHQNEAGNPLNTRSNAARHVGNRRPEDKTSAKLQRLRRSSLILDEAAASLDYSVSDDEDDDDDVLLEDDGFLNDRTPSLLTGASERSTPAMAMYHRSLLTPTPLPWFRGTHWRPRRRATPSSEDDAIDHSGESPPRAGDGSDSAAGTPTGAVTPPSPPTAQTVAGGGVVTTRHEDFHDALVDLCGSL